MDLISLRGSEIRYGINEVGAFSILAACIYIHYKTSKAKLRVTPNGSRLIKAGKCNEPIIISSSVYSVNLCPVHSSKAPDFLS